MELGTVAVRAFAKVNLHLEVLYRRPDGYHEIRTVLQTIDLHDTLEIGPSPSGADLLEVRGACDGVPAGRENLVLRAAALLRERLPGLPPARFRLSKAIPAGGGLGGGSSDAAAALRGLLGVARLVLEEGDLRGLAARLGSDVPFFLEGGTCLAEGRGERVTPLEDLPPLGLLLLFPGFPLATAEVYGRWKSLTPPGRGSSIHENLGRLRSMESTTLRNDLEAAVVAFRPELLDFLAAAERTHPLAFAMTGSGSAVCGLYPSPDAAREALRRVGGHGFTGVLVGRSEYRRLALPRGTEPR